MTAPDNQFSNLGKVFPKNEVLFPKQLKCKECEDALEVLNYRDPLGKDYILREEFKKKYYKELTKHCYSIYQELVNQKRENPFVNSALTIRKIFNLAWYMYSPNYQGVFSASKSGKTSSRIPWERVGEFKNIEKKVSELLKKLIHSDSLIEELPDLRINNKKLQIALYDWLIFLEDTRSASKRNLKDDIHYIRDKLGMRLTYKTIRALSKDICEISDRPPKIETLIKYVSSV